MPGRAQLAFDRLVRALTDETVCSQLPNQTRSGPSPRDGSVDLCVVRAPIFLFLAVLGLLVIGIVMLFSTSAYARDSHGDVYFFIKRQAIWIWVLTHRLHCCGAGELPVLAEDLVGSVRAGAGCSDALFYPAR